MRNGVVAFSGVLWAQAAAGELQARQKVAVTARVTGVVSRCWSPGPSSKERCAGGAIGAGNENGGRSGVQAQAVAAQRGRTGQTGGRGEFGVASENGLGDGGGGVGNELIQAE